MKPYYLERLQAKQLIVMLPDVSDEITNMSFVPKWIFSTIRIKPLFGENTLYQAWSQIPLCQRQNILFIDTITGMASCKAQPAYNLVKKEDGIIKKIECYQNYDFTCKVNRDLDPNYQGSLTISQLELCAPIAKDTSENEIDLLIQKNAFSVSIEDLERVIQCLKRIPHLKKSYDESLAALEIRKSKWIVHE